MTLLAYSKVYTLVEKIVALLGLEGQYFQADSLETVRTDPLVLMLHAALAAIVNAPVHALQVA